MFGLYPASIARAVTLTEERRREGVRWGLAELARFRFFRDGETEGEGFAGAGWLSSIFAIKFSSSCVRGVSSMLYWPIGDATALEDSTVGVDIFSNMLVAIVGQHRITCKGGPLYWCLQNFARVELEND